MASLKKRGTLYYIQYYSGPRQHRVSTGTDSLQIAKEKLRQFESAQLRGDDIPLSVAPPNLDDVADLAHAVCPALRTRPGPFTRLINKLT